MRSTDNGQTWSSPVQLSEADTNQYTSKWMPSLSVNYNPFNFLPGGKVTVSWYDRRQATSACNTATDPGCSYERVGIQSPDNGVSWGPILTISDQIIPQPTQNDSGVQACYAGDYDYNTALAGTAYVTWTDGRVSSAALRCRTWHLKQSQSRKQNLAETSPGGQPFGSPPNFLLQACS